MERTQILEKLQAIFRDIFDEDDLLLTPSTSAGDIEEWDSLNQIKIILRCEQVFGISLNARKIAGLSNVGEMIDYLDEVLRS